VEIDFLSYQSSLTLWVLFFEAKLENDKIYVNKFGFFCYK